MEVKSNIFYFSKREIAAVLQIWNRAAISILDIRHNLIAREEAVRQYRLPASAFLFAAGRAELSLNDTRYQVDRFGLFHGGKGTELSIDPQDNWLEYYLIFYKYGEPTFHRREFHTLLVERNPFRQQYGFSPANPLLFVDQLKKLFERWKEPTSPNLFYAKGAFYAFVYEIYAELENGNVQFFEPDIIAIAARYLDEHYREDISIQELCGMLGISYSHFHRGFKQKLGSSPKEYLINTRLEAAKGWMESSGASLREIAVRCGLGDEQGLYRLFKNKAGVSPSEYRENLYTRMRDGALQNNDPVPYNWESRVSLSELKGKGDRHMFKQMQSKAVVAAALSLMLLLSACGTGSTPTSTVTSQVTETETTKTVDERTRIVSTVMGDVEIPIDPQRIAFFGMVGDLVAIGTLPICGNVEADLFDGLLTDENYTYTIIDDFENILSLSPDLIFVSYQPEEGVYKKLSAIAPTVVIDRLSLSTADRITFIGEIIGQEEAAAEAVAEYENLALTCRTRLEDAKISGKTITVMEEVWLMGEKYGRGANIVYNYLGFTPPEKLRQAFDEGNLYFEVSMEVMSEYCGDYIIRSVWDGAEDWSEDAIWNSIPAVASGHVLDINFDEYAFEDLYTSAKLMKLITDGILAMN